ADGIGRRSDAERRSRDRAAPSIQIRRLQIFHLYLSPPSKHYGYRRSAAQACMPLPQFSCSPPPVRGRDLRSSENVRGCHPIECSAASSASPHALFVAQERASTTSATARTCGSHR